MALVVFMRGVNVGGHKAFQPSAIAKSLTDLDVVNVGAAGTFVVRKAITQAALRQQLERRLPFEADMVICSARDVLELHRNDPFGDEPIRNVVRYVTVLAAKPREPISFPICQPPGKEWQVKVLGLRGRFVFSLHRRMGRTLVYPNQVIEKQFKVPATTRNWNTVTTICDILKGERRVTPPAEIPGTDLR